MNLPKEKFDLIISKPNIPKVPHPNNNYIYQKFKSSDRFDIEKIISKNYHYPNSYGSRAASSSSLSQRSGSRELYGNSDFYSNEDIENENEPINKQLRIKEKVKGNYPNIKNLTFDIKEKLPIMHINKKPKKKIFNSVEREKESSPIHTSTFEKRITENSKIYKLKLLNIYIRDKSTIFNCKMLDNK